MTRLTIDTLGHRGDGVAPGPVYVTGALPGEVVEGEVTGNRMAKPRIHTPSADRVRPPCPHFRRCGGCTVQHAADPLVREWKCDLVRSALAAQGLPDVLRRVRVSEPGTRRRAVLSGVRTKSGAQVGFFARASATVVAVPDCAVLTAGLRNGLAALEALTGIGASRKAPVRFAVIDSIDGLDVAVSEAKSLDPAGWSAAVGIADSHDLARLTWNGERVIEHRPPRLRMGRAVVVPPPGAFLQATADGEAALQACVAEAVGQARSVVDLFSGVGTFALVMAARAAVHAVEGEAPMLAALDRAWRHGDRLHRITTETRDLFRRPLEVAELARHEAAVIDPPRAGAEAQVARLADGGPARIAMVSCNPQTFARDTRRLVDGGYTLEWIDVIDQFRWSTHVELAAALTR